MQEFKLENQIKVAYKQNKNTPRIGLSFNFSINEAEDLPGTYCLMSRLLMQGTKNRSAQQIADELDENAIEFYADMKQDYLRFRLICLNEDFEKATEIMADIIKNTTFEEFDKERIKMQGEITAELDDARTKAFDNYYKTIYGGHFYGHTYTTMLENLDKITKQDVIQAYAKIVLAGKKVLAFVGDIEAAQVKTVLNKFFNDIDNSNIQGKTISKPELKEAKTVEIIKSDAQQAQIIQGWILPTFKSEDYPALLVLNVILGSAGLSSRLFLELREKKGLAYHVRSSYETNEECANFSIYIATEPKNVEICLEGFKTEINKLKETQVNEIELENAKSNFIGKQQFVTETNSQQVNQLAYFGIMNLGFDFQEKVIERVKQVTPKQIQDCAIKYFGDISVVSVLRPEKI